MKILLTSVAVALVLIFLGAVDLEAEKPVVKFGDTTGRVWTSLPKVHREMYISGYFAGLRSTLKAFRLTIRSRKGAVTGERIQEEVYQRLLSEPEIREGEINKIINTSVGSLLLITTLDGQSITTESGKKRWLSDLLNVGNR